MKALKAAICLALVILISALALPAREARAESAKVGGYAYADLENPVYFCSEKRAETALFAIPPTYCVQVLSIEGEWLYVRYAEDEGLYRATYGYCRNEGLIFSEQPPENTYLNLSVTVIYKAENGTEILPDIGNIEVQVAFYGEFVVGDKSYMYVLCKDKFGYISGEIPPYPLNPLPSAPTFNPDGGGEGSPYSLIVALVITVIAAIAVTVLYLSGKKKPK